MHHTIRYHSIPWQQARCDGCYDFSECLIPTNLMKQEQLCHQVAFNSDSTKFKGKLNSSVNKFKEQSYEQSVLSSNNVEFKAKYNNGKTPRMLRRTGWVGHGGGLGQAGRGHQVHGWDGQQGEKDKDGH